MGGYFDIEDALQSALNSAGFSAHAKPLPADFQTPCVTVWMTNAQGVNAAQAVYSVDFDCRADGEAEAMVLMLSVANWARTLGGSTLGGVTCYEVGEPLLQGTQPDAAHPTVILATASVNLRLRIAD